MAREGRRAQAAEALTFEREREEALREQLREVVLEQEGDRVDADAFARMSPDDVTRVRKALRAEDDDGVAVGDEALEEGLNDDGEAVEAEIRRLQDEIEGCRAAQQALERYVGALDETP